MTIDAFPVSARFVKRASGLLSALGAGAALSLGCAGQAKPQGEVPAQAATQKVPAATPSCGREWSITSIPGVEIRTSAPE